MKSMKALNVGKVLGRVRRRDTSDSASSNASAATPSSTPELTARNSVKAFCESGGKHGGDDVLFLPPIVDAAESSPAAAAESARVIRKFMSKDYSSNPSWQYNAVMLVRILADHPGPTFTRALDQKFVDTTKALLKNTRDPSVRQILFETLDDFEHTKMYDENLALIISMWKKEKEKALKEFPNHQAPYVPQPPPNFQNYPGFQPNGPPNPHSQNYFARSHRVKSLPDPVELASRLEEARTSAKLLEQVVMNTPPPDVIDNELIKEFADRCQSASRSIQGYMMSENPTPDNDTMGSLIDTNEQLQTALNQHQRAILNARKQLASNGDGGPISEVRTNGSTRHGDQPSSPSAVSAVSDFSPPDKGKGKDRSFVPYNPDDYDYDAPAGPPPGANGGRAPRESSEFEAPLGPPPGAAAGSSRSRDETSDDPFADPSHDRNHQRSNRDGDDAPAGDYLDGLAFEPFHPGFGGASDGAGGARSGKGKAKQRSDYEVSDDEEIYDSSARGKEPSHRV